MTAQDIITEARATLLDSTATYRWADATLLGWLNDGMNALYGRRPDCVLLDDDTTLRIDRPAPLAEVGDPVPLEVRWRPALVFYVVARAYEGESDEVDAGAAGRALAFMARFEAAAARA